MQDIDPYKVHVGIIAQEIHAEYPKAVTRDYHTGTLIVDIAKLPCSLSKLIASLNGVDVPPKCVYSNSTYKITNYRHRTFKR